MIEITNTNIEAIDIFKNVKDKNLINKGLAIAESEKVVLKALNSEFKVHATLSTKEFYDTNREVIDSKTTKSFVASKEVMEEIVGFNLHHGVMALIELPDFSSLDNLGNRILIFNGVMSAENVGTMTRAALAFGFDSIIYDYKSASPYLRRCIRVSMGNVFEVRVARSEYLPRTISKLQANGYQVFATANEDGAKSIKEITYPPRTCIVIGNEGNGMDREVIDACDEKLYIPISNYVAHLNAASAASIFLYHSLES